MMKKMATTPKDKIALLKRFAANAEPGGVDEFLCVPFGTGVKVVQWLKNTVFRKQVELQKAAYIDASPKQKRQIALHIVESIEASNGIFVEFDPVLDDWKQVVDQKKKVMKAMQALRQDAKIFRQIHQKEQIRFYAEIYSNWHLQQIHPKHHGQNQIENANLNISFYEKQNIFKQQPSQEADLKPDVKPLQHDLEPHPCHLEHQQQHEKQHQDRHGDSDELQHEELHQFQHVEHHLQQNEKSLQLQQLHVEPYPLEHRKDTEQERVRLEDFGNAIWPLEL